MIERVRDDGAHRLVCLRLRPRHQQRLTRRGDALRDGSNVGRSFA
jgi:hypothetical protein